jgi:chaperonin GroES
MQIKPLFDKILLVLEDDKKENSTGIILPELAKEKPNIAKVVACGNGGKIDGEQTEIIVKVGNKVLFNKYATSEFKFENTTYLIIKQSDILAILED